MNGEPKGNFIRQIQEYIVTPSDCHDDSGLSLGTQLQDSLIVR